ncbi:F-box associated interaction domain-containing protein [Artemisia annua]|uniref:F-box associated interaction domain-containing protein n=1 Tax=Artemisia annua TaxID=35608 RepID=A0A2U1LFX4_ARTAN|nr:F-box associated interaction domain-containing protein [Artemisia annua]
MKVSIQSSKEQRFLTPSIQKTLGRYHFTIVSDFGLLHSVPYNNDHEEAVVSKLTIKHDYQRLPGSYGFSYILGSVNGLVLAKAHRDEFAAYIPLVLNPTTKDYLELPISIYNLRTNTWKHVISHSPYGECIKSWVPGVFVNGFLHWIVKGPSKQQVILAFSLADEKLSEVPPPNLYNKVDIVSHPKSMLGALGEKLAIFNNVKGDIWLMNEYGVQKSWTKIVLHGFNEIPMGRPRVVYDNGKVLSLANDLLWIYDVEEHTLSYPNKNRQIQMEDNCVHDRTHQPASLYAATKKAGEEIPHTYNHIYGLSITGLRFFTVYGPWGRPDMANALEDKETTILSLKASLANKEEARKVIEQDRDSMREVLQRVEEEAAAMRKKEEISDVAEEEEQGEELHNLEVSPSAFWANPRRFQLLGNNLIIMSLEAGDRVTVGTGGALFPLLCFRKRMPALMTDGGRGGRGRGRGVRGGRGRGEEGGVEGSMRGRGADGGVEGSMRGRGAEGEVEGSMRGRGAEEGVEGSMRGRGRGRVEAS